MSTKEKVIWAVLIGGLLCIGLCCAPLTDFTKRYTQDPGSLIDDEMVLIEELCKADLLSEEICSLCALIAEQTEILIEEGEKAKARDNIELLQKARRSGE